MAPFNPDVPKVNEPNYMGMSQAISQPEPNRTAATALKGIGDIFSAIVKGTDDTIKGLITDKVHEDVNTELGGAVKAFETATEGGLAPKSLISGESEDKVPSELSDGIDDVETLGSGMASSTNAIHRLNLRKELYTRAKELRSRFPGYRDFIDQKYAEVLGRDPANKYLDSLIATYNSLGGAAQKDHKQALQMAKEGLKYPGGEKIYQDVVAGKYGAKEVAAAQAPFRQIEYNLDIEKKKLDLGEAKTKESERDTTRKVLAGELSLKAQHLFENLKLTVGGKTPRDLYELTQNALAGQTNASMTSEEAVMYRQQAQAFRTAMMNDLKLWGLEKGADGRTRIERLGPDGAAIFNKSVEDNLYMIDQISKNLSDGNIALVAAAARRNEAIMNDFEGLVMENPQWRAWFGAMNTITKRAPVASQPFLINSLGIDLPGKFAERLTELMASHYTVPPEDPRKRSLKDSIEDMQRTPGKPFKPEHYKKVVDIVNDIANPDWDNVSKKGLIWSAYGPRNNGFLDKLEGKDAQASTYAQFTSPGILSSIKKIADTDHRIKPMVVNWAQTEFIRLFQKEVFDMNNLQANPNFKLEFKPENHQFQFLTKPRSQTGAEAAGDYKYAVTEREKAYYDGAVARLNNGLVGLGHVAEWAGFDPAAFALRRLIQDGFRPAPGSVAAQFLRSMAAAKDAENAPQNASQSQNKGRGRVKNDQGSSGIAHYDEETKTPTLGDWLSNPTGARPYKPGTNLSDGTITGMEVLNVPPGITLEEFSRVVKERENKSKVDQARGNK